MIRLHNGPDDCHTPLWPDGPWHVEPVPGVGPGSDCWRVVSRVGVIASYLSRQHADLIAAAPELCRACALLARWHEDQGCTDDALHLAHAAMAKARGEA